MFLNTIVHDLYMLWACVGKITKFMFPEDLMHACMHDRVPSQTVLTSFEKEM